MNKTNNLYFRKANISGNQQMLQVVATTGPANRFGDYPAEFITLMTFNREIELSSTDSYSGIGGKDQDKDDFIAPLGEASAKDLRKFIRGIFSADKFTRR